MNKHYVLKNFFKYVSLNVIGMNGVWLSFTFAEIITTIFLSKLKPKVRNNGEIMNY